MCVVGHFKKVRCVCVVCGTFKKVCQEGMVCVVGHFKKVRCVCVVCGTFQEGMLCVVGHFKKVRCVCGVWDIQEGKVCVWCVLIKEHFKKVCTVCGVREWVAGHFKKVCVVCVYSTCVLLSTIPNMRRGNM